MNSSTIVSKYLPLHVSMGLEDSLVAGDENISVTEDDGNVKEKEIDKLIAFISLSIKQEELGYDNQSAINVVWGLGNVGSVDLNVEQVDWRLILMMSMKSRELDRTLYVPWQYSRGSPDPVDNFEQSLMMSQCLKQRWTQNSLLDSLDYMVSIEDQDNKDDTDDLDQERELLAS
ncbi:hypothetical protein Tco_1338563 [Tanacetum coccineum]